jgi:hypothetical protein
MPERTVLWQHGSLPSAREQPLAEIFKPKSEIKRQKSTKHWAFQRTFVRCAMTVFEMH